MSKIFERHVHLALYEYLNRPGLLFKYQSGFRPFYSCETAMIELVDRLLMNTDNGLLIGLSLIDFREAFDLVDHGVLLKKLVAYQLSEESIQWFKSYLEGRLQKVSINGVISSSLPITSGVPQGSLMGPLLLIIFINGLPLNVTNKSMYTYADDTTQVVAGHNVIEVASTLEEAFETSTNGQQINEWRWTLRRLRVYWHAASLNIHHLPRTKLRVSKNHFSWSSYRD